MAKKQQQFFNVNAQVPQAEPHIASHACEEINGFDHHHHHQASSDDQ